MLTLIKKYNEIRAIEKDISKTKVFVGNTVITDRLLDYLNTECMLCNAIDTTEINNESQLVKLQKSLRNSRLNYQRLLLTYQKKSLKSKYDKDYQPKLDEYLKKTNMKYVTCANRSLQSPNRKKAEYTRKIEFLNKNI